MQHDQAEEWREVPGYPGVWASSWGRVHRRSRDGLNRAGQRSQPTYGAQVVRNTKNGATYIGCAVVWVGLGRLSVSRLVCAAFHGPQPSPEESYVLHGDDDPQNNRPENLRWGTQEENLAAPGYRQKQREAWVRRKARRAPDYASAKDRAKMEHAAAVLRRLSPEHRARVIAAVAQEEAQPAA